VTRPEHSEPRPPRSSAVLAVLIMIIGSLVLWVATPLAWLWVGSQIENSASLGTALAAMFAGAILTITVIARVLSRLSNAYRQAYIERGLPDPGHAMLEMVLVVSAGLTLAVFVLWFLIFAGASPVPIGLNV
jgi:hypothetical protein